MKRPSSATTRSTSSSSVAIKRPSSDTPEPTHHDPQQASMKRGSSEYDPHNATKGKQYGSAARSKADAAKAATGKEDGYGGASAQLLELLEEEIGIYLSELQPYTRPSLVCRLCPHRRTAYPRMSRLADHIKRDHIKAKLFVPSGRKQMRLIIALHDHDLATGQTVQPTYIARSASMMSSSAPFAKASNGVTYDNSITLLLDV